MGKRVIEGPASYEISPDMDEKVAAMTEQADRDVEEVRVNMRWRKAQVDIAKRAARTAPGMARERGPSP